MSGWSNPDVTPVRSSGPPRPAPPPGTDGSYAPPPALPLDPFGAQPDGKRRGRIRVVVGLVLSAACLVVTVVAFVQGVSTGQSLGDDAVAQGVVGEDRVVPATFTAPAAGDYTVYVHFDGFREGNDQLQEDTVGDTVCEAALPGGGTATIRGDRQGQSVTLEDNATIGWFSTPAGEVTVTCTYERELRTRARADEVEVLVVAGKPSVGDFVVAFAAAAGLVVGIFVTIWGFQARHRRW